MIHNKLFLIMAALLFVSPVLEASSLSKDSSSSSVEKKKVRFLYRMPRWIKITTGAVALGAIVSMIAVHLKRKMSNKITRWNWDYQCQLHGWFSYAYFLCMHLGFSIGLFPQSRIDQFTITLISRLAPNWVAEGVHSGQWASYFVRPAPNVDVTFSVSGAQATAYKIFKVRFDQDIENGDINFTRGFLIGDTCRV